MKFDMHCHTAEGSPDSKVSIIEYTKELSRKGFSGMLISDHNSYKGYEAYKKGLNLECPKDFVVLKGIEYDTIDAGHFLVIMPEKTNLKILELRGLPVFLLIEIVHKHGGILGPAHSFGERFLSIFHTGIFKKHRGIASHFDFIEGFNACEDKEANDEAMEIALKYNLPVFGGSDSHWPDSVGFGYTEFSDETSITSEDDLISYIQAKRPTACGGSRFYGTTKDKLGPFNHLLVQGFWFYNKFLGLFRRRKRNKELKHIK